jgi:hypothetical protein
MIATDFKRRPAAYLHIHELDCKEALKKFASIEVLFLSWPPLGEPMGAEALKRFQGRNLIYIGEKAGGSTGDEQFHRILNEKWSLVDQKKIEDFYGVYDAIHVYVR